MSFFFYLINSAEAVQILKKPTVPTAVGNKSNKWENTAGVKHTFNSYNELAKVLRITI